MTPLTNDVVGRDGDVGAGADHPDDAVGTPDGRRLRLVAVGILAIDVAASGLLLRSGLAVVGLGAAFVAFCGLLVVGIRLGEIEPGSFDS